MFIFPFQIKLVQLFLFSCGKFVARNLTEEEKKGYKEVTWDSKEVCSFYMVRFCPHDLFVNTRSDLGESMLYLLICFVLYFFFPLLFEF